MKRGTGAVVWLLCALFGANAFAEVVGTRERNLAIKYKDGAVERYRVAWAANLATSLRDEGGSFVPYQGAVETRRCSWTITTTIERTVSLATRLGPTFPIPGLSRTIKGDSQRPDGEFMVSGTIGESCKDAAGKRESDIRKARDAVTSAFDRVVESDLLTLRQDVQSKGDVVTIGIE
jgi:hypothetical protein